MASNTEQKRIITHVVTSLLDTTDQELRFSKRVNGSVTVMEEVDAHQARNKKENKTVYGIRSDGRNW